MAALASISDVEARIGRDLGADDENRVLALLDDASAAVRAHTGRPFGVVTTTLRLRPHCGVVTLHQPGITAVTTVTTVDGTAVTFEWDGLNRVTLEVGAPDVVKVTFTYGSATVPDAIRALVAQMAARAFGRPADTTGVTSETIAGYSYNVGSAAASGAVGLLPDEKALLDRFKAPAAGVAWMSFR